MYLKGKVDDKYKWNKNSEDKTLMSYFLMNFFDLYFLNFFNEDINKKDREICLFYLDPFQTYLLFFRYS